MDGSPDPWTQNIVTQPIGGENPTHIIAGGNQIVAIDGVFDYAFGSFSAVKGSALIRGDILLQNDMAPLYTAFAAKEPQNG